MIDFNALCVLFVIIRQHCPISDQMIACSQFDFSNKDGKVHVEPASKPNLCELMQWHWLAGVF